MVRIVITQDAADFIRSQATPGAIYIDTEVDEGNNMVSILVSEEVRSKLDELIELMKFDDYSSLIMFMKLVTQMR